MNISKPDSQDLSDNFVTSLPDISFDIFINNLPIFDSQCHPVKLYDKNINCLLYADDFILSENECGLQNCLDKLQQYCVDWNMTINMQKSKVVIFNKSGRKLKRCFTLGNEILEVTHTYCYLGIELKTEGSFSNAIKILSNKAMKAVGRLKR